MKQAQRASIPGEARDHFWWPLLLMALLVSATAKLLAGEGNSDSPDFTLDLRNGRGMADVGQGEAVSSLFTLDLRGVTGPEDFGPSAESGVFTVNLLGLRGGLSVSGTVYDGASGQALPGVTVQVGTNSTPTDSQGAFGFTSLPMGEYTLTASLVNYAAFSEPLVVSAGAAVKRTIHLEPFSTPGLAPRITSVRCKYPGFLYFLDRISFNVTFTANVDWAGHPPGKVQFFTPHGLVEVPTSGTSASQTFNMGQNFGPAGKLRVGAVSSDGTQSAATLADLLVIPSPLPAEADAFMGVSERGGSFAYHLAGGYTMPFIQAGIAAGVVPGDLPLFGKCTLGL